MEFLIGCGSSVVGAETGNSLLPKVKKHIGYLFNYNHSVEGLKAAESNLDVKIRDANRFVHDTDTRLKDVSATVTQWRSEAEKLHQKAQTIIADNNRRLPLNPWLRYSSSKNSSKLAQEINQKVQTTPDFGTAFDRPAPESGSKFNLKGCMDFDSRLTVLNGVLEALKDEEVSMCSICGMGGVGKTTLAKKLILSVERDHLFDKVAMVTVSQNPDFEKIQNEIIELLELKIGEVTIPARANKLNDWLTNNKTLLILDDVWWQLNDEDFEKVGIPLACKGCKIVVTSRNEDECKKMGSQPNFLIDVLEDGEAWGLFTQKAGKCIDDLNLRETARKIADECVGLPIAIVTIATALKDNPIGVWNDSLRQLQKSNLLGISGMAKVLSRIQLSYDLLNDREAQSCFLLCCLFPEDHNVPVEHLVLYGKGLQLFENVETMKEARDRVETIIDRLMKSFLLLEGGEDGSVKMHDIVRDFAISISSKDKDPYVVGCEKVMKKWPATSHYENCSAISFICDKIEEHPVDLRCQKLQLLQLCFRDGSTGLPIGFFEGMKELKVLDLVVPPLSQPLTTLKKLRTLRITETTTYSVSNRESPPKVGDLLGHGDLKNLEILAFATKRPCDDFPKEIGLLCNLRLLKFDRFMKFKYIPPGVLSKLVKLEELELPWEFISWGCKEEGGERVSASLNEIEALPLTALKISITKGSILAENLVKNLTRFDIFMGSYSRRSAFHHYSNTALEVFAADARDVTMSWMSGLLRKCVSLTLIKVRNLKNIMCLQSVEGNGFPQLKDIFIRGCNEMEYLVGTRTMPIQERIPSTFFSQLKRLQLWTMYSLKEIWHGPYFSRIEAPCFSNLSRIEIYRCPKLKHIFPLSVAKELRQLQRIHVWECDEMEEGFYKDEVEDEIQIASSVQLSTPAVESTTSTTTILNPSTSVNSNIDDKPQLICPTPILIIRGLLTREKHSKMVSSQQIMEENIAKVEEKGVDPAIMDTIIFRQLKILKLVSLHKLRILYVGNHAIELPSLEELRINGCNEMEALSYGSFNAPRLEEIEINSINYPAGDQDLNAIVKKMLNREMLDTRNDIKEEDVKDNDNDKDDEK